MIWFKRIFFIVILNAFFVNSAFALRTDFESVRSFHDQEIDQLLKDYTLEESLTVRAELKRKEGELKEQKVVDIPGLYQKTGEADDRNIESVLNLYDRKFVIIKKREVADKEIELVKQALAERLYLPKDTVFTTIDNLPNINNAVQNLKSDFLFGAYSTLIKNGQFLWILIFSIGFIIALWVLAKVWKTKGEAGPSELTISGGFPSGGASNSIENLDSSVGRGDMSISMNNSDFETFNFTSLCQNINDSYIKTPGSTSAVLWKNLPDFQTQIQFFEVLKIQTQVPNDIKEKTGDILNKIYDFEKRASRSMPLKKSRGINKDILSAINVELAKLKFTKPNVELENCLQTIYPNHADRLGLMFQKAMDHHVVLYKLFNDEFMSYLTSIKDDSVLSKIDDLLTFDPVEDHASSDQYKAFSESIKNLSTQNDDSHSKKSVNSKIVHMILGLSEYELAKIDGMKKNEDLKAEVPTVDWIVVDDLKMLKDFFSNLSGAEIKFLIDFDPKFNTALGAMDERAQFRFKERMNKEASMVLNWREFRHKIGKNYKYVKTDYNDVSQMKAS